MPSKQATKLWKQSHPDKVRAHHSVFNKSIKHKYSALKATAKYRKLDMTLTKEEFTILSKLACSYCGTAQGSTGYGLDRRDHKQGYILANVCACCSLCNRQKGMLEGAGFSFPRTVQLLTELIGQRKSNV